MLPARDAFAELLRWYERALPEAGVTVRLNKAADAESVKAGGFDVCVLAHGRGYKPLPVPVAKDAVPVYSMLEYFEKRPVLPKRVAVIGGSFVGLEIARQILLDASISPETLFYRMRYGVEPDETLHAQLRRSDRRVAVFEKGRLGAGYEPGIAWPTLGDLKAFGAELRKDTVVTAITAEGVETAEGIWPCKAVVVCPGTEPDDTLFNELSAILPCHRVGNSARLGRAIDAIEAGCALGCAL